MKYIPFFAAAMLLTTALVAGTKNCRQVSRCNNSGSVVTAGRQQSIVKDVGAMELELRGVRDELTAVRQTTAELQEAFSTETDLLIEELAAFKTRLEKQQAVTVAEKERADKAEVTVARLQLTLNTVVEVRDGLSNQVKTLTDERQILIAQANTANLEIEHLKKEVFENGEVTTATKDYEANPPKDDDSENDTPAEEEPNDEEDGEETPNAE